MVSPLCLWLEILRCDRSRGSDSTASPCAGLGTADLGVIHLRQLHFTVWLNSSRGGGADGAKRWRAC